MKKWIVLCTCVCAMVATSGLYAGHTRGGRNQQCCPEPTCGEYSCGECYCRYMTYEPIHYCTERCIEEKIPCKKKCYRMVPEYYQVQKCRYVPQYYCETKCRERCECYEVDDCKTCTRKIKEPKVRYVPRYYWKHECRESGCPACPQPCDPCCNGSKHNGSHQNGMNYNGSNHHGMNHHGSNGNGSNNNGGHE